MSVIWFRPVMYKFISRAGIVAYAMLQIDRAVRASPKDGAAKMCREGIAKAEPIIVWGRVNLHRTERNEDSDRDVLTIILLLFDVEEDGDIDSERCKISL